MAKPGEKRASVSGHGVTVTAKITSINRKNHLVTLIGPADKSVAVEAEDLEKVKVGDQVEIT